MKQFKRSSVVWSDVIAIVIMFFTSLFINSKIVTGSGWFINGIMFLSVVSTVILFIILIAELATMIDGYNGPLSSFYKYYDRSYKENPTISKPINFKKYIFWIVLVVIVLFLFHTFTNVYSDCIKLYNKSKVYSNNYNQKVEEKKGFYDKLWKTYLQKEKITNVNKETFIQVTKVIMENRADGKTLTWKWVQENQQIPYNEFTKFYGDLSDFITEQREGYFNIEKDCQKIANQNNTLLDTFPNNLYNKVLKCKKINFEYGFTSDSTENVFKTGKENIK